MGSEPALCQGIESGSNRRPSAQETCALTTMLPRPLYDYLDGNKLLFSKQSGFRFLHSVVTCLLKCTSDWHLDMDKGQYTAMMIVDLKKAFNTIDHEILLKKLKKYAVIGTENAWFASYLCKRMQFCRVNGVSSRLDDINCGVGSSGLLSRNFTVFDLH